MKTILLIALLFVGAGQLSAQELLKTIGGAAKSKVEQQDFNTTRSNKDKNSLQNKRSSKKGSGSGAPELETPAPASTPSDVDSTSTPTEGNSASATETPAVAATYKQEYAFDGMMTYEMDDLKKSKKSTMSYHYSETAIWTEMPESNSSSIFDYENEVMIMFDEKAKTATVMSGSIVTKMAGKTADAHAEKVGKTTVTKTGKTKVILGYNCEEYLATNEDGSKTEFWITTEAGFDNSKIGESITKNMKTPMPDGEYGEGGLMMEFTSYNKKGEGETHMIMTAFNKDAFTKALKDYTVTVMAF